MITIEKEIDLTNFKKLKNFENIEDKPDKYLIEGDFILDKDMVNNSELAITGRIIFIGGNLVNKNKIYLINKKILTFTINSDLENKNNVFTGISLDESINSSKIRLIISQPEDSSFFFKKIISDEKFFYLEKGKLYLNIKDIGIIIYKKYKLIIELL
jgi:hypothetical protein